MRMRKLYSALMAAMLLLITTPDLRAANVKSGSNTCPSSGAKQLSTTQTKAMQVSIQGGTGNTGRVYIGGSTVTTTSGIYVSAGVTAAFLTSGNAAIYDLTNIYFACTQNTDTITFNYVQ